MAIRVRVGGCGELDPLVGGDVVPPAVLVVPPINVDAVAC